jgi:LysR family glycine cleavage system transcriptional activator
MSSLPNLLWLRSFEAVSRLGGFTAAGAELGLTQAAVSTHISSLETQLGHQLFERTTRKLELTASGQAYLPAVRKALQELAVSTDSLFGNRSAGSVTIRAPISEAVLIIAPALTEFQKVNPTLDIRLLSAIWADTALDTGTDILGFDDHWPSYFDALGLPQPSTRTSATVDTSLAAVELAAAGGGVALLLGKVATRLAATGRLTTPLFPGLPSMRTHYLLNRDNASPRKPAVQRVETWLRDLFAA